MIHLGGSTGEEGILLLASEFKGLPKRYALSGGATPSGLPCLLTLFLGSEYPEQVTYIE